MKSATAVRQRSRSFNLPRDASSNRVRRSAQKFVDKAARRNVVDEEIESETKMFEIKLGEGSQYVKKAGELECKLCPDTNHDGWSQLVQEAAVAVERKAGLAACINAIHKDDKMAKVLVFAP